MFYWSAYQDLSTERPQGGFYTIPYFKIMEYARAWRADVDLLKTMIWSIDSIYLDYWKEKADHKTASQLPGMGRATRQQGRMSRAHG